MRIRLATLAATSAIAFLLLAAGIPAQACNPGDPLLKNDILPNVPAGPVTVAIVPGLCEGEAAMAVLDTPGACYVRKVSVMFGNSIGTNGIQAVADIEIYDGATLQPTGRYTPDRWSGRCPAMAAATSRSRPMR
jgi:hypothetical protein